MLTGAAVDWGTNRPARRFEAMRVPEETAMLDQSGSDLSELREPSRAAESVSLVYSNDEEPGFRRKRAGRGFFYVTAKGGKLTGAKHLDRIRMLAIPPAWTDVWIAADPDGHLQATGRDVKGRKQYRYHERWAVCRDAVKFSGLAGFAESLPTLRDAVDHDLRRRGLPRERVVASVVWLLDNTMIRVGNAAYARDNGSFGLTTLKSRHLEIEGAKLRFSFKGKSGKEWRLKLVDRRIAGVMRSIQELPGQHLFQYHDEDGDRRTVRSEDVNAYIRDATGAEFSSKHFRTWGGTVHAATLLSTTPLPETKTARNRTLNGAIDIVAAKLGNTRAVCRSCYIHPGVLEAWQAGNLTDEIAAARRSWRKLPDGFDEEEMTVLRWLQS
jgi:DNA topoisomerase-1